MVNYFKNFLLKYKLNTLSGILHITHIFSHIFLFIIIFIINYYLKNNLEMLGSTTKNCVLSNVNISNPQEGQMLLYQNGEWKNQPHLISSSGSWEPSVGYEDGTDGHLSQYNTTGSSSYVIIGNTIFFSLTFGITPTTENVVLYVSMPPPARQISTQTFQQISGICTATYETDQTNLLLGIAQLDVAKDGVTLENYISLTTPSSVNFVINTTYIISLIASWTIS